MTLSAYASPAPPRASVVIRHPVTASIVVVLVALLWATIGFSSSLFTNDIVVADESHGLIRSSITGPAILMLLCAGAWLGSLWRVGQAT